MLPWVLGGSWVGANLLDFPTIHGAADINHKDYVLGHHWKALGCKEVHKIAIDYLQRWERRGGQHSLTMPLLAKWKSEVCHWRRRCPISTLQEVCASALVLTMEERDAATAPQDTGPLPTMMMD